MEALLLEIGTEEIPAGYIQPALEALRANLLQKLQNARIEHGEAVVFGTPRRLAVRVAAVSPRQASVTSEVIGPPAAVGFDADGKATVAGEKFAQKVGVPVGRLVVKETPKGAYVAVEKTERGLATRNLLREILPEVILATPFPKKMRWADLDIEFARPIHHIVALLGGSVVAFELGNLKSDRHTRGHHFMAPGKIRLSHADDYVDALKSARVVADFDRRKQLLLRDVGKVAAKLGGNVLADDELADINTNLVEYPIAAVGQFDREFLEVPDEVLINAMREHQKYFSVVDPSGRLMPCFIAINNTRAKDMKLVASGHERVIRARLADAKFFYNADLQVANDERVEKLKRVLFQAKLGTMYEKMERVRGLAQIIAGRVSDGDRADARKADLKERVARAATLCKSDLVSHVVGEFPKLQGVMGRIYAGVAGELPTVAGAVEEHYRPVFSGAPLPETTTGAVLGIADKIDSICGCFSVGLLPTGASDPYALRRQGIGIAQILQRFGFSFSLKTLIRDSLGQYGIQAESELAALTEDVYNFIKNRILHLLAEEGYSRDVIAAVIEVTADDVPNVWKRVAALEALKRDKDFEPLAAGFKRVGNILKKSGEQPALERPGDVRRELFEHESESALHKAYEKVARKVAGAMATARYEDALREIASLRKSVDDFFDGVMVMTENERVRDNRLNLLGQIASLFDSFADFSKIST